MLDEVELVIDLLKTTFDGRAWHGPSFMDTLKDVNTEEAGMRPVDQRHTIWEIVNHCAYWMDAFTGALKGKEMPRIVPGSDEDWPQMGATEEDWIGAKEDLRKSHEALVSALASFDESYLGSTVPGRSYTYQKMIHGISDHNVYHAGQIAVFRKKR